MEVFCDAGTKRARASRQSGARRAGSREVGVFEGRKGCARLHNTTLNMKLAKVSETKVTQSFLNIIFNISSQLFNTPASL